MKFEKRKKRPKTRKKPLDTFSARVPSSRRRAAKTQPSLKQRNSYDESEPRGRPRKMPLNWVTGHAYDFRIQLSQMWATLEVPLLKAQTAEEVTAAFQEHGSLYADGFVPRFVSDILTLIHDPKFPKRPEARINFLADSLGGRPKLSFRSSRDICEGERAKQRQRSPHHIVRKEFYVECSCGYKGPALDNACRECGARIGFSLEEVIWGRPF